MAKLRKVIRCWLGLEELPAMIRAREKADLTRHEEAMTALAGLLTVLADSRGLLTVLAEINQKLTYEHVTPRQFTPAVLDWETVQAIALHNLEQQEKPDGAV
jgi:hypothetical protein